MTVRQVTVILAAAGRGRAIVPTVRSVVASSLDARVVVGAAREELAELRRVIDDARLDVDLVDAGPGAGVGAQRAAAAERIDEGPVVVVGAGDVLDAHWLSEGVELAAREDAVVHPALAVAFGFRFALWHQPAADLAVGALATVSTIWAAPSIMPAAVLRQHPHLPVDDGAVDAEWQARTLASSVRHLVAEDTVVFVRAWDDRPLIQLPEGESTGILPSLDSPVGAVLGELAPARTTERSLAQRRISRAARAVLAPWRDGARRIRARVGGDRISPAVRERWRAANAIEPYIPYPLVGVTGRAERWDAMSSARERALAFAAGRLAELAPEVDYLFVAPWLQLGGGDTVLLRYAAAVRRLDPTARVLLVTTEPVASTRLAELPEGVLAVELRTLIDLTAHREAVVDHLLPQFIAAAGVHTIHAFNTTVGFDVVERYGDRIDARVFLSTFTIDRHPSGERTSVMFHRSPRFLDSVECVIVDSEYFVDLLAREHGYERARFAIQRHIIPLIDRHPPARKAHTAEDPLRVLWAARFDVQKRLDILAAIARRVREEGLPVELHFFGEEVMGDPELPELLRALTEAGAVRHPAFARFADLPLGDYGAFLMTSEWEGVPNTLAEAMAAGFPIVAPLVGGIGEVLDDSSGFPIERFDDVDAYVDALRSIIADPANAERRGDAARARAAEAFSVEAFDARLRAVEGYLRTSADES